MKFTGEGSEKVLYIKVRRTPQRSVAELKFGDVEVRENEVKVPAAEVTRIESEDVIPRSDARIDGQSTRTRSTRRASEFGTSGSG